MFHQQKEQLFVYDNFIPFLSSIGTQKMEKLISSNSPTIDQTYISTKLETYRIFQSSKSYEHYFSHYKKKIMQTDVSLTLTIIDTIRIILTYRHILGYSDIAKIEKIENFQNDKLTSKLELNQFSKLLALRFIRELYFECQYSFMIATDSMLTDRLTKIAQFRKNSLDEERGKYLFSDQNEVIFLPLDEKGISSNKNTKQLQIIGFSIHKITLEIIYMAKRVTALMPYHEYYCENIDNKIVPLFHSSLTKYYQKLTDSKVKFPSKFHYFKQTDEEKIKKKYSSSQRKESIRVFYRKIFNQIEKHTKNFIGSKNYQNGSLCQYFSCQGQPKNVHAMVNFCHKIGNQSNDRYFWVNLREFIDQRLLQLRPLFQRKEDLTEDSLYKILVVTFFISFFCYKLANPEIMQQIQRNLIESIFKMFKSLLLHYFLIQNNQQERKTSFLRALLYYFKLLELIKQICIELDSQLKQSSKIQTYPIISIYIDIILQVKLKTQMKQNINMPSDWVYQTLIKRIIDEHDPNFNKLCFIFHFYKKNQQNWLNSSSKAIKQRIKEELGFIIKGNQKYLDSAQLISFISCVDYITIKNEQVTQEEVYKSFLKPLSINSKIANQSSYRLNHRKMEKKVKASQLKLFSVDDKKSTSLTKIQRRKTTIDSQLSFVRSLNVDIEQPSQILIQSLSKKTSKPKWSSLVNIRSDFSLQKGIIQRKDLQKKNLSINQQIDSLKNDQLLFKKEQKMSRGGDKLQEKQHYNFEEEINKQFINQEDGIKKISRKNMVEKITPKINSLKDRINLTEVVNKDKIEPKALLQDRMITETLPNKNKQHQICKINKQLKVIDKTCFNLPPKIKKELLRAKVLILKTNHIEIGMITNLQSQMTTKERKITCGYKLMLKLYITAIVEIKQIRADLSFPCWLVCNSQNNYTKETLLSKDQIIVSYILEINEHRLNSMTECNYADFPQLRITFNVKQKAEILTESLPILVNKFALQKYLNQVQLSKRFQLDIMDSFAVYQKIALTIAQMKTYFPSMSLINLEPQQKLQIFKDKSYYIKDSISLVKLQFIQKNQNLLLLFFENENEQINSLTKNEKGNLRMTILPLNQNQWVRQELYILTTTLRSILSTF